MKTLYEDKLNSKTSEDNYCVHSQEYFDGHEQPKKKILMLHKKLTEMGEKKASGKSSSVLSGSSWKCGR